MARFAKGMKVQRTFFGTGGYTEVDEDVVESVKDGVVRTKQCENGITFDAVTGRELENFFPGMHQEIVPLEEHLRPKPKVERAHPASAEPGVGPPLTEADFANPMFDWQAPRWRKVGGRTAIEWGTFTDEYVKVGCTYLTQTGQLTIVCGQAEHLNLVLYDRPIDTKEQFAKAMKAADRAYKKLRQKK